MKVVNIYSYFLHEQYKDLPVTVEEIDEILEEAYKDGVEKPIEYVKKILKDWKHEVEA